MALLFLKSWKITNSTSISSSIQQPSRPITRVWLKKIEHAASRLLTRQDSCDSTRLCWCVRTAAAAIESKLKSQCRVFVSLTGLDWTRLDSVGVYALLVNLWPGDHSVSAINVWQLHDTATTVCAILRGKLWEMTGHDCFRIRIIWTKMEFTNKQTLSNARNVYFNREEV